MSIPYRSPRRSTPSERLTHFARPMAKRVTFVEAAGPLARRMAAVLDLDPASRQAGCEDARAGRPAAPAHYDDVLAYLAGYASGKGWRR